MSCILSKRGIDFIAQHVLTWQHHYILYISNRTTDPDIFQGFPCWLLHSWLSNVYVWAVLVKLNSWQEINGVVFFMIDGQMNWLKLAKFISKTRFGQEQVPIQQLHSGSFVSATKGVALIPRGLQFPVSKALYLFPTRWGFFFLAFLLPFVFLFFFRECIPTEVYIQLCVHFFYVVSVNCIWSWLLTDQDNQKDDRY